MKNIDASQLDNLLIGAKVIEADGHGTKVAQLVGGDFIKLYRRKRLISSDLWELPAKRFAANAQGLQQRGIIAPYVLETFLISERRLSAVRYQPLPGDTLRNYLRDACDGDQSTKVENFGNFLGKLHESGVYFRSLHLGNVLLLPDHSLGLIDLSDMKFEGKALAHWKRRRNLQHILRYKEDIEWLIHRHREAWISGYKESASTRASIRFAHDIDNWMRNSD